MRWTTLWTTTKEQTAKRRTSGDVVEIEEDDCQPRGLEKRARDSGPCIWGSARAYARPHLTTL